MAIACSMRTPVEPQSKIKGFLYSMDWLAPGILRDRRPWEEPIAEDGDEAGTSGGGDTNDTGRWGSVYGPPTPMWLHLGGLVSIPAEPGQEDDVVAIACAMRMPVDPESEIKGSLYGMDGLAPGFL